MKQILSITRKEVKSYFGSPMALIFIGAFLAVTLFVFFWGEAFFARGVADVRPLFRGMPVLLIFLIAALTMRQWSEEQRSGTLEMLLTLPVRPMQLVIGKFLAVMMLVAVALALTLPLPITVSNIGNLDWGPVLGGYLAALLLAAAYTAIGLFVSALTDNQIVALIATILLGGSFYMIGSSGLTNFTSGGVADILHAIGTGSRFDSIERGVIDLRDLVYYISLASLFLMLNAVALDRKRWSKGERTAAYRRGVRWTSILLAANLIFVNVWLYPLFGLRLDLTQQGQFSLSQPTKTLLGNLPEPLYIRAYLSEKTHHLLAPLIPEIRDMLKEYQIAANGKLTTDVVDPISDAAIEAEANQTYGIQSSPLQDSDKSGASIVNAYFDILIRYGDQTATLNFRDLIEAAPNASGAPDIHLRNLEYDLTRTIKKVIYGFQSIDAVLSAMKQPVKLQIVVTPNSLPDDLKTVVTTIANVAGKIQSTANGKFTYEIVNPDDPQSAITRQTLVNTYKIQPIPVSFFSDQTYYLDILLTVDGKTQVLSVASDYSEASVKTAIESGLKRGSSGFLKVVGLWTPPPSPAAQFGGQPDISSWQDLQQQLSQNYTVTPMDLTTGQVPTNVDVLVVVAPQNMSDKERYAIDQYLMRGGAVIVAAGNYSIALDQFGSLGLQPVQNGLQDMLDFYGVHVDSKLVMDPQNASFPMQVSRVIGGLPMQQIQLVDFPFFADVRPAQMDRTSPIVSQLPFVTMNFVSPITLDPTKNANRTSIVLLNSSARSWLRTGTDVQPNPQLYPDTGYLVEGDRQSYPLAVSVQGGFDSYFKGVPSPFKVDPQTPPAQPNSSGTLAPTATPAPPPTFSSIDQSPDTARLVVIGSAEFVDDALLQMSARLGQNRDLANLQLMQNAVDWSVEDLDLLTIRSRGSITRVLNPMDQNAQLTWIVGNGAVMLLALIGLGLVWYYRRRNEEPMVLKQVDQ
jgi:ABC-2 type transport system permease protein